FRVDLETWGREFGDIILVTWPDLLVSERFRGLWEKSDLSGLADFSPVEIATVRCHRKIAGGPPLYFRATAMLSRTGVDYAASGHQWMHGPPKCEACRVGSGIKRWNGIVIDQSTWTWEDVFVPRATSSILASERFRTFCDNVGVTNIEFCPAETFARDFY